MRWGVRVGLAVTGIGCCCLAARALQAQQDPQFRVSVDLLTIDAVVLDADGRHVTDLTAADFELRQSGRTIVPRQAVYVRAAAAVPAAARGAGETRVRDLASLGPSRATTPAPETVARTIAIVVDDLGLSFESTVAVRAALHRFVEQQIHPGDLVAILRTAGGVGALQQFTMDKRLLRSAADRVLWTPVSRTEGSADQATGGSQNSLDEFRSSLLTTGALVTLEAAVAGLQHLPGRKAVVFFSEEFDLFARRSDPRVWSAMRRLVDRANLAGVVVYAMDARGLVYVRPGEESRALHESQEGLRFLAGQTGGFAVVNTNDLNGGLDRVLHDQQGYYLIGYEAGGPGVERSPDRVEVVVKRAAVRVRARRGWFGPALPAAEAPPADSLELTARSPFSAAAITMRLTALFGYDSKQGAYVHAVLLIDPNDLQFSRDADGRRADIELLLLAVGDNGAVAGRWHTELTVTLTDEQFASALEQGLLRSVRFATKAAGPYQIRAAVRDKRNGATGSGTQFLIIPKVGRGQLAVSGVVMRTVDAPADTAAAVDVLGQPTIRLFQPGSRVVYACEVYDGLDRDASVVSFTTLFRQGRIVSKSEPSPVVTKRTDGGFRTVPVAGTLTFGQEFPPGAYALQVSVGRMRAGKVDVLDSQWSEFEVR